MQPGEIIKKRRKEKRITQVKLAEAIGLKQGYISDLERGRQLASREAITKINMVLDFSADEIVQILNIPADKDTRDLWPAAIAESHDPEYGILGPCPDRRLPENAPKRRIIDKVIKILNSGNKKFIKALKSNIEAFLPPIESRKTEIKEGD